MSKELFERDLEQAKTLFDLRAVLGAVNECSLKNPVWSRRVHDLISHFDGIDLFLPTWEEQVRTVLGEIRTEMAKSPESPESKAFYDKFAANRDLGIGQANHAALMSGPRMEKTGEIRTLLRDLKSRDELAAFCRALYDGVEDCQGDTIETVKAKIGSVGELLEGMRERNEELTPEIRDRIKSDLVGAAWMLDRQKDLPKSVNEGIRDRYVEACQRSLTPLSVGFVADDSFRTESKTDALREQIEEATTIDELEVFCKLIEETPYNGISRAGVEKSIDSVRDVLSTAKEQQRGRAFGHFLPAAQLESVKQDLIRTCKLMDLDPALPAELTDRKLVRERLQDRQMKMDFFDLDEDRMLRTKAQEEPDSQTAKDYQKIVQTRTDWSAARNERIQVQTLRNNLPHIANLCDKMEKEGSKLFGDSAEYDKMRKAAYQVRDIAAGMKEEDFRDPEKLARLDAAMKDLHAKAQKYAEDKVYGKQKKTATGISRKNTALALIDLSTPGGSAGIMRDDVEDYRLTATERKETAKRKRGLSQLIHEEKAKNERAFGHKEKAEKEAAEYKAKRKAQGAATRKSDPKKAAPQ